MATENCTCTCKVCGSDFTYEREVGKPGRLRRYCSDACKAWIPVRVSCHKCAECGREFTGRKKKYCSLQCRNRHYSQQNPGKRNCAQCGVDIPMHAHGRKKYCSAECRTEGAIARSAARQIAHDCEWCGSEFTGTPSRKYCSTECRDARNRKASRDSGRKASVVGSANCQHCGVKFEVRANTGGLYCSRACNLKAATQNPKNRLKRREKTLKRNAGEFCSVTQRNCFHCGDTFIEESVRGRSGFCSVECNSDNRKANQTFYYRFEHGLPITEIRICRETGFLFKPSHLSQEYVSREVARAVSRRITKARRRAMELTNGRCEAIDPFAVFRSVGYVCQGCGKQTHERDRGTFGPDAPELDHIVPLSKGGTHTWGNVTLLCRACNGSKSDAMPEWIDERQTALEL